METFQLAEEKLEDEEVLEVTYLMQQIDTNGIQDITRPCKTMSEFIESLRQYGIKRVGKGQRLVKRFEVPFNIDSIGGDYEDPI